MGIASKWRFFLFMVLMVDNLQLFDDLEPICENTYAFHKS